MRKAAAYFIFWQRGQRFNDGSQRDLALFGLISGAGQWVGGAADESWTGVAWRQQKRVEHISAVSTLAVLKQNVEPQTYVHSHCARREEVLILFTLILNREVSGDERRDLSSDVCAEDLSPKLCFVVFYHLGLKQNQLWINVHAQQLLG